MRVGICMPISVSVVMPFYRAHDVVGRAITSIARQTVAPRELIVVDDASGTESAGALEHALAHTALPCAVRVLRLERNVGAGEARNAGWSASSGDYVAFIDADDAWHPRKLEVQYAFMTANPAIGLAGHRHSLVASDSIPEPLEPEGGATVFRGIDFLVSNRFVTPSVMVRRTLDLRFKEGRRFMEDQQLWALAAFRGHGVARLEAQLCYLFKPAFGHAGLSANLVAMEAGELENLREFRAQGYLGRMEVTALRGWSVAKFARRVVLTRARRALPASWFSGKQRE